MKTLEKLKAICKPHNVEVDYYVERFPSTKWHIYFDAPPKMCWGSTQSSTIFYPSYELKGIISFIRSELKEGFYEADEQTLRETGQQ